MAFLSGETLQDRLSEFVRGADAEAIDCSAIALRMGSEVVITESHDSSESDLKQTLEPDQQFKIPPGQFAFLLTEEEITVPPDCMAFISLKTRYKFKGLINASGFHVDPGWAGKLIFTVYNAGAKVIVLARGEPLFLIWYSYLDQTTAKTYGGKAKGQSRIGNDLVENAVGHVYSPQALTARIKTLESWRTNVSRFLWAVVLPTVLAIFGLLLPVIYEIGRDNWIRVLSECPLSSISSEQVCPEEPDAMKPRKLEQARNEQAETGISKAADSVE